VGQELKICNILHVATFGVKWRHSHKGVLKLVPGGFEAASLTVGSSFFLKNQIKCNKLKFWFYFDFYEKKVENFCVHIQIFLINIHEIEWRKIDIFQFEDLRSDF
jgi:hypothetical protein